MVLGPSDGSFLDLGPATEIRQVLARCQQCWWHLPGLLPEAVEYWQYSQLQHQLQHQHQLRVDDQDDQSTCQHLLFLFEIRDFL